MLKIYQNITSILERPMTYLYTGKGIPNHLLRHEERDQRFGLLRHIQGPYDIWMHAASVGEVAAASAILHAIKRLSPETKILLSVWTHTGYSYAIKELRKIVDVVLAPFDLPLAVYRAFKTIRPRIYALLETELWPNTLLAAQRYGIPVILLNARISKRSFRGYMRLKPLFSPLLQRFQGICAISQTYKDRMVQLGAASEIIQVTGNAKFEGLLTKTNPVTVQETKRLLGLNDDSRVFVAGSIRGGEEQEVAKAVAALQKAVSNLLVILVPRHLNRICHLQRACDKAHLAHITLDRLLDEKKGQLSFRPVILVNRMGLLFSIYSIATVAFVGGSLVPKGGQNPMEPAAWACPVFFGPHMENFEEAKEALEATGGALEVRNAEELAEAAKRLLLNSAYRDQMGKNALIGLQNIAQNAATSQAAYILKCLNTQGGPHD